MEAGLLPAAEMESVRTENTAAAALRAVRTKRGRGISQDLLILRSISDGADGRGPMRLGLTLFNNVFQH